MSVNLILKTTDISPSNITTDYYDQTVTTSVGYVTNSRTSFSWKNINIKVLLGDLYEKYEKFQIALIYVSGSSTGITTETATNKRMLQVKLSGLPFLSSYNQAKGLNTNIAIVSVIKIPTEASTTWINNNNIAQYFVFTKQAIMDFNIDLITLFTDRNPLITSVDTMIGHCLFSFTITPVFIPVDEMKNEKLDIKTYGYNKNF